MCVYVCGCVIYRTHAQGRGETQRKPKMDFHIKKNTNAYAAYGRLLYWTAGGNSVMKWNAVCSDVWELSLLGYEPPGAVIIRRTPAPRRQ